MTASHDTDPLPVEHKSAYLPVFRLRNDVKMSIIQGFFGPGRTALISDAPSSLDILERQHTIRLGRPDANGVRRVRGWISPCYLPERDGHAPTIQLSTGPTQGSVSINATWLRYHEPTKLYPRLLPTASGDGVWEYPETSNLPMTQEPPTSTSWIGRDTEDAAAGRTSLYVAKGLQFVLHDAANDETHYKSDNIIRIPIIGELKERLESIELAPSTQVQSES